MKPPNRRAVLQTLGVAVGGGALLSACGRALPTATAPAAPPNGQASAPTAAPTKAPPVVPPVAPPKGPTAGTAGPKVRDRKSVTVTLTHDLVCPWCRIGHHRLELARAQLPELDVQVRYAPFLLHPGAPPEGEDLRAYLGAKYGAAGVERAFQRVTAIGKADGVAFHFDKVRRASNTELGHTLVDAAPAAQQTALVRALHAAYFERGDDLGDAKVLTAAAASVGLKAAWVAGVLADDARRSRVRSAALAASRRGVRGVPYLEVGDQALRGAVPLAQVVAAMKRAVAG